MRLLARLIPQLLSVLSGTWYLPPLPSMAASWFGPQPLRMGRPGKSGVSAARRAARKARNRRRQRHGRA